MKTRYHSWSILPNIKKKKKKEKKTRNYISTDVIIETRCSLYRNQNSCPQASDRHNQNDIKNV